MMLCGNPQHVSFQDERNATTTSRYSKKKVDAKRSREILWGPSNSSDDSDDEENNLQKMLHQEFMGTLDANKRFWDKACGSSPPEEEKKTASPLTSPKRFVRTSNLMDSLCATDTTQLGRSKSATTLSRWSTRTSQASMLYSAETYGSKEEELSMHSAPIANSQVATPPKQSFFTANWGETCSPCSAHELEEMFGRAKINRQLQEKDTAPKLGIAKMELEELDDELPMVMNCFPTKTLPPSKPTESKTTSSPADRRRQRALERQRLVTPPTVHEDIEVEMNSKSEVVIQSKYKEQSIQKQTLPVETLIVSPKEAQDLQRSISELTMRSSYQDSTSVRSAQSRRMAYYAVGKHHKMSSGKGGNRRCYFTGKLILGGGPFYAGSVQQGLRTLVVFCLPSALGLPKGMELRRVSSFMSTIQSSIPSRDGSHTTARLLERQRRTRLSRMNASSAMSKTTSTNWEDVSLSIEGELDPNWNLDKDYLLEVLPHPSDDLLKEISRRYPDQFETLPVQVRTPSCWRLYVKFCFFSGLPIAEGELHYKVRDEIAFEVYGEEIALSHDVMIAVNGTSSAEILRLPNLKTFSYLEKHYQQQSSKLPEVVFTRSSWELVRPEV